MVEQKLDDEATLKYIMCLHGPITKSTRDAWHYDATPQFNDVIKTL